MTLPALTVAAPQVASQRLLVLMFTDLVNSTAIKEQLGSQAYAQLLNRHDAFIRQALEVARGGRVLQDTGDGYFLSFDSVAQAVGAALVFQWLMAGEAWPVPFATRVGLHLGEVDQHTNAINEQEKFVGSAIDLASRVMSLARGGQILLTRAVFDAARQIVREHPVPAPMTPAPPLQWMAHGPYMFKGATEPMDVFEVGAEGSAPLAPPPDTEKAKRHIRPGDEETLGWRPALGRSLESTTNWILVEKLGEGGFGEVWLAEQNKTAAKRVFKFCFDPDRLRALKREVVLFRLLKKALGDRRDIAAVKEWQFERPPYFIELDYTAEGNLTQWAERQGGIDKVPLADRLRYVAEIAHALAAAHSVGILHKDIKPSNILMARDHGGPVYPRLTDFGIGILTDRSRLEQFDISGKDFSAGDMVMNDSSRTGTRMYQPPEALLDQPHTVQGDVYALGVLLYQMTIADLARPLGVGWDREVTDELLREDIAACVDVDPANRLPAVTELAERLQNQDARHQQRLTRLKQEIAVRLARRRRTQVRLLGTALIIIAAIAMALGSLWRDASIQHAEAVKQQKEATSQRSVATREAEVARLQERRARAALAQIFIDEGWKNVEEGDVSFAMLRFIRGFQTDPTPSNQVRATYLAEFLPRLVDSSPGGILANAQMSRTGRLNISGKTVAIVDIRTGKPLTPSLQHAGYINHAAFSPDGARAVTASEDQTARVWDAQTGQSLTLPLQHADSVNYAEFSPDGRNVVTASEDQTARVWDAATGKPVTPPLQHSASVNGAAFSPDGTKVVTTSIDKTARVWDAVSGRPITPALQHADIVVHAAFSPDGARVVTASADRTAQIWDAVTGIRIGSPLQHADRVKHAEFSPDGGRVVTASVDRTARVWDAATGKPLIPPLQHTDVVMSAAFSPDGSRVATDTMDGITRVWDAESRKPLASPLKHVARVLDAEFSPDGYRVVTASLDGTAQIWDVATGKSLVPPLSHGVCVANAAFSLGGTRVVTASMDHTARVWDAMTGEPLTLSLQHAGYVNHAAFSPDGARVVTASEDQTARVWDAQTGQPLTPPLEHAKKVKYAAFSPDGSRVVTASWDQTARVWDARTGQPLTPPVRHELFVSCAAFSPDGTRIVTASGDRTARVWDAGTGKPLSPPLRHRDVVNDAEFSPDGTQIVTASGDHTAQVWDAAAGKPLTPPLPHADIVWHAAFSPDGRRVVTASLDGTARIWSIIGANLSDSDLLLASQVTASHRLDESGVLIPLAKKEWRQLFADLSTRYPERFLPPTTKSVFDAEIARTPADPARLKMYGEWFHQRGEPKWAAPLLDKARAAGATDIDPLLLARCHWMADEFAPAAAEFRKAIAANKDPVHADYLKQCLAAVERALVADSPPKPE
ncbi:MAG: hypothetical protein JWN40_3560 [Phycisphaerales bacterium]|nr:hypothetical protein [Phycisphaerales bacterium]